MRGRTAPRKDMEALRGEMDDMRRELGEVQERLDFAERLLARPEVRDRRAIPESRCAER